MRLDPVDAWKDGLFIFDLSNVSYSVQQPSYTSLFSNFLDSITKIRSNSNEVSNLL